MKNIFGSLGNFRLGQDYFPGGENPYLTTPVVTPVSPVPKPPALLPDNVQKMDEALANNILAILRQSKSDRARITSWWDSNPNAEEILGDKLVAYSKTLEESMQYDDLIERLEFRISQGGDIFIKDSERAAVSRYQDAVGRLVAMVEGKTKVPLPATAEETKDIVLSGGIAAISFVLAAFL